MNSGITIKPMIPGIVSELEERDAAKFSLIPWPDFKVMNRLEKADVIAYFRIRMEIDAHTNDEMTRRREREAIRDRAKQRQ